MVYREIIQKMCINQPTKHYDKVMKKIKILAACDGKCEAAMKVEIEHSNTRGMLHSGFIATIVDLIPSYALITHPIFLNQVDTLEFSGATINLHTSYLKEVKVGEDIIVKAETLRTGKTTAYLECKILNKQTGDVCVIGTHLKTIAGIVR